jgi:hypothetical protein
MVIFYFLHCRVLPATRERTLCYLLFDICYAALGLCYGASRRAESPINLRICGVFAGQRGESDEHTRSGL